MTGHEIAARVTKRGPSGEACAEDRGLCEIGAVLGTRKRVLADRIDRQLEQIRAHLLDGLSHFGCLTALAREQDCGVRGFSHASHRTQAFPDGYSPYTEFPPFGGSDRVTNRPRPISSAGSALQRGKHY